MWHFADCEVAAGLSLPLLLIFKGPYLPDVPICDGLLTGFHPDDKGPYASYPEYVELIPTLGALFP